MPTFQDDQLNGNGREISHEKQTFSHVPRRPPVSSQQRPGRRDQLPNVHRPTLSNTFPPSNRATPFSSSRIQAALLLSNRENRLLLDDLIERTCSTSKARIARRIRRGHEFKPSHHFSRLYLREIYVTCSGHFLTRCFAIIGINWCVGTGHGGAAKWDDELGAVKF